MRTLSPNTVSEVLRAWQQNKKKIHSNRIFLKNLKIILRKTLWHILDKSENLCYIIVNRLLLAKEEHYASFNYTWNFCNLRSSKFH